MSWTERAKQLIEENRAKKEHQAAQAEERARAIREQEVLRKQLLEGNLHNSKSLLPLLMDKLNVDIYSGKGERSGWRHERTDPEEHSVFIPYEGYNNFQYGYILEREVLNLTIDGHKPIIARTVVREIRTDGLAPELQGTAAREDKRPWHQQYTWGNVVEREPNLTIDGVDIDLERPDFNEVQSSIENALVKAVVRRA